MVYENRSGNPIEKLGSHWRLMVFGGTMVWDIFPTVGVFGLFTKKWRARFILRLRGVDLEWG